MSKTQQQTGMAGKGDDRRLYAPASARNRDPILAALKDLVAPGSRLLEVASGSGEHAIHCAGPLEVSVWQPSDPDPTARASIEAWRAWSGSEAIALPLDLDAALSPWPTEETGAPAFDTVLSINMIHIAPWSAAEGLVAGAARNLTDGGRLVLYGPFKEGGRHTAPSNEAFDHSLKARDPSWGVRDRDDVKDLAARHGLAYASHLAMPANNQIMVFSKGAGDPR